MKNKKIISLVCALAMIFTMFSSLVVNAAETKGISLASSISKDDTVITVDATATGTVGKLKSFGISFAVPEGVANSNVKATAAVDGVTLTKNVKDGVLTLAFVAMPDDDGNVGVDFPNGKLVSIAITLPSALTSAQAFTLLDKSSIADDMVK